VSTAPVWFFFKAMDSKQWQCHWYTSTQNFTSKQWRKLFCDRGSNQWQSDPYAHEDKQWPPPLLTFKKINLPHQLCSTWVTPYHLTVHLCVNHITVSIARLPPPPGYLATYIYHQLIWPPRSYVNMQHAGGAWPWPWILCHRASRTVRDSLVVFRHFFRSVIVA
jgi:hypothetical protein